MEIRGNVRYDINLRYNPQTIECKEMSIPSEVEGEEPKIKHGFALKLSGKDNNGLQFNDAGQLIAIPKVSEDAGWGVYYAGNTIKANPDSTYGPVEWVRCNSAVSRIQSGDPEPTNEGVNTLNLIHAILDKVGG